MTNNNWSHLPISTSILPNVLIVIILNTFYKRNPDDQHPLQTIIDVISSFWGRIYQLEFLNRFSRSRALDYSDSGKFVVVRCELHKTIMNAMPTQIYFTPVSRQRAVLWHDNNYLNFFFLKYAICATASDSSRCFPFAHYINFSKIFF